MKKSMFLIVLLISVVRISSGQNLDNIQTTKEKLHELDTGIFLASIMPTLSGRSINQISIPDLNVVLSNEYTRVDSQGKLFSKADELEAVTGRTLPTPRKGNIEDYHIEIFDAVAIIRSVISLKNEENYDMEPTGHYRVTNLYIKRNEGWRLVSSHWTRLKI
ncbi:MAG: nuclear transport factor 2 family protein [Acidobacteriota bacterium]|nr:MAG: nuclear transport factor 2 family protein [Acidobacteriota bacterium]